MVFVLGEPDSSILAGGARILVGPALVSSADWLSHLGQTSGGTRILAKSNDIL